jgi:hypothetical protein
MDLVGVHQVQCLRVAPKARQRWKLGQADVAKQGYMSIERSIGEPDAAGLELLDEHRLDCLYIGIVVHSQPQDASSSLVEASKMRELQADRIAGKPVCYFLEKRQQARILLTEETQGKVQIGRCRSSALFKQLFEAVLDGLNCVQRLLIKSEGIEDSHGPSIGFRDLENHTIVVQEETKQYAHCTHWSWKRSVWLGYAR